MKIKDASVTARVKTVAETFNLETVEECKEFLKNTKEPYIRINVCGFIPRSVYKVERLLKDLEEI
jgi:hypothetical protein